MLNTSELFSVLAFLLAILLYYAYNGQMNRGVSKPNPATWIIWLTLGILNTITYFLSSEKDWFKIFILLAVNAGMLFIIIKAWKNRNFTKIGLIEELSFMGVFIIGLFYFMTNDYELSQKILQGIYVLSFIPTIEDILKKKTERPLPWIIAVFAYGASILSVATDPEANKILYLHLIINGVLGNGTVALLAWYVHKK